MRERRRIDASVLLFRFARSEREVRREGEKLAGRSRRQTWGRAQEVGQLQICSKDSQLQCIAANEANALTHLGSTEFGSIRSR